jgi:hypothetical protein
LLLKTLPYFARFGTYRSFLKLLGIPPLKPSPLAKALHKTHKAIALALPLLLLFLLFRDKGL